MSRNCGRDPLHANLITALGRIAAAVSALGHTVDFKVETEMQKNMFANEDDEDYGKEFPYHILTFDVDGEDVSNHIMWQVKSYKVGWREYRQAEGEYDITVGNYGDRQRFPLKKDGTHSYELMAPYLSRAAEGLQRAAMANAQEKENRKVVKRLGKIEPIVKGLHVSLETTHTSAQPVRLSIKYSSDLPELAAAEILNRLRMGGIIK